MHAKGAVADRRIAFLTSANLTGRAFDDNIEVGLRVVGGDAPRQLHDHFLALMSQGVLTPMPVE
jgi:phosphatidylserine/phosphatidylglycerophosphate/cardiolipin synthase-like enzyme